MRTILLVLSVGMLSFQAFADINIIQIAPFSGNLALTGKALKTGAMIYFESVNRNGGVNGTKITLHSVDDGYKTSETVRLLREMASQGRFLAGFGLVGSENVEKIIADRLLDQYELPFVGVRAATEKLNSPDNAWLFSIRPSYGNEVLRLVQLYSRLGYKQFGIVYQNDSFGNYALKIAEDEISKNSGKIVAKGFYEKNSTNLKMAAHDIASANPDIVLMLSNTAASSEFIRIFRSKNHTAQLVTLSVTDAAGIVEAIGPDVARGLAISQIVPSPDDISYPIIREFKFSAQQANLDKYKANHSMVEGYLAAKVLVEAIRRAGKDASSKKIRQVLEEMRGYDAGGITIGFSPTNHVGSVFVELTMVSRDGKIVK